MKWLAALLLLLNAALFLWATGHDPSRAPGASPYPVVNPEAMRLLSEVRQDSAEDDEDAGRCARIGPFVDSAVMSVAAQKLDALSLPYSRRTVKAREIRAYRVYLGPFQSQSAVQAQSRLLDEAGVDDYYVKNEEDGGRIISLGLFSQRDGARVLRQRMLRRDIRAKLRTEDRVLESNFWLEIDSPTAAGDIPEELSEARWGEKGARVRRYDCP